MFGRVKNSFIYAGRGFKASWKEELSFQIEVLAALFVIECLLYFRFTFTETMFCLFSIILVLSAEIINTAIEDLCNKVEPNHDALIGKVKDIMAAFVTLVSVGAFVVGLLVFYHHFFL